MKHLLFVLVSLSGFFWQLLLPPIQPVTVAEIEVVEKCDSVVNRYEHDLRIWESEVCRIESAAAQMEAAIKE